MNMLFSEGQASVDLCRGESGDKELSSTLGGGTGRSLFAFNQNEGSRGESYAACDAWEGKGTGLLGFLGVCVVVRKRKRGR